MSTNKKDTIKEDNIPLLNWPPSRGPMPEWMTKKPEYKYPKSYRVIIERPIVKEARAEAEKEAIESIKSTISGVKKGKLFTVFKVKNESKVRKVEYIDLEVDLCISVEELCKISLYSAMQLINCWSKDDINDDNKQYMSPRGMVYKLPELPITTTISYPLSNKLKVTIKPYTIKHISCHDDKSIKIKHVNSDKHDINKGPFVDKESTKYMDVAYFLWRIVQEYKYIYKNHEKFGVWGHCLSDLVFEGVKFNKNGTAELYIGS